MFIVINDFFVQTKKVENIQPKKLADGSPIIAVLVFSCDRITVQRCLDQLIKIRPNAEQFPLIVSQDCDHDQTANIIERYSEEVMGVKVIKVCHLLNSDFSILIQ